MIYAILFAKVGPGLKFHLGLSQLYLDGVAIFLVSELFEMDQPLMDDGECVI